MRRGATLVEVLMGAVVLLIVVLAMGMFQGALVHNNQKEKDRAFAIEKCVQMMEEVQAYQQSHASTDISGIDSLGESSNEYSFLLTVDPSATATEVTGGLSGNIADRGTYRFVRQVTIAPVANDQGARTVQVAVYYSDGTLNCKPKSGFPALAALTNTVKAVNHTSQPNQVYDMYLVDLENTNVIWNDPFAYQAMLSSTLTYLQTMNPGLQIRQHWIRRMAYGRDPYYTPTINQAQQAGVPCTESGPYTYIGNSGGTYEYVPTLFGAQINIDGTVNNPVVKTTDYLAQPAYSVADPYNHALRYFDEQAKYQAAVAYAQAHNQPTPEYSLRMLLDQMAAGQLMNAIVINLHGENIPMPPLRNYSDAARVPQASQSAVITNYGLTGVSSSDINVGSTCRLVTHPRQLHYNTTDTVELWVHPYRNLNVNNTLPGSSVYHKAIVVLRGLNSQLASNLVANSLEIDALGKYYVQNKTWYDTLGNPHQDDAAAYYWDRAYPNTQFTDSGQYAGTSYSVVSASGNGLLAGDILVTLDGVNYIPQLLQNKYPSDVSWDNQTLSLSLNVNDYYGLNSNQGGAAILLHGCDYFPDPLLPTQDTSWQNNIAGSAPPFNTAQFKIKLRLTNPDVIEAITAIGPDTNLNDHQWPNLSRTWTWVGQSVPLSEQYQLIGDPRENPYLDVRNNQQYNRAFLNMSNNNAYLNNPGGYSPGWNTFANTADGWNGGGDVDRDLTRYFELFRQAMLGSNAVYMQNGFSDYYLGWGMDASGSVNKVLFGGANNQTTGLDDFNASTGNQAWGLVADQAGGTPTWYARPWLGEIWPDARWSNWSTNGNLPSANYCHRPYSQMPSWRADGNATFERKTAIYGSGIADFYYGGTAGNSSNFIMATGDAAGTAGLTANGTFFANAFHLYLPSSFSCQRPFKLNETSGPPADYANNEFTHTTLSWGLPSNSVYLSQTDDSSREAMGPVLLQRSGQATFYLQSGVALFGGEGTMMNARLNLAGSLQALFDMANPGLNLGDQAIKLLPYVQIQTPVQDTQLTGGSVNVSWNAPSWVRWDGQSAYSNQFSTTTYAGSTYKPALIYDLKYSADGGNTWYCALNNQLSSAGAIGTNDQTMTGTTTSYTWDYASLASGLPSHGQYLLRLECFRKNLGANAIYTNTHYSYHQVSVLF